MFDTPIKHLKNFPKNILPKLKHFNKNSSQLNSNSQNWQSKLSSHVPANSLKNTLSVCAKIPIQTWRMLFLRFLCNFQIQKRVKQSSALKRKYKYKAHDNWRGIFSPADVYTTGREKYCFLFQARARSWPRQSSEKIKRSRARETERSGIRRRVGQCRCSRVHPARSVHLYDMYVSYSLEQASPTCTRVVEKRKERQGPTDFCLCLLEKGWNSLSEWERNKRERGCRG